MPVDFDLIHSGHSNDLLAIQVRDFDASGSFRLDLDFNIEAFDRNQRVRATDHYLRLLDSFLEDSNRPIQTAGMLSEHEIEQTLHALNRTAREYNQTGSLHELIEAQVRTTPDSIALIYQDTQLSYAGLNRSANRLARALMRKGAFSDSTVGICIQRSVEMVVSLLAVLKAGAAYAPLDPEYPAERLAYMIEDAAAPVLITRSEWESRLPKHTSAAICAAICIDVEWQSVSLESSEDLNLDVPDQNLAYVIYTSGSTGKPKGAMIQHAGIRNRLLWMQEAYGMTPQDRVLQKTPFSFDVSVWEFFWPVMTGACLVVAEPGGHRDPLYLMNEIDRTGITTIHFVPSMLQAFLSDYEPGRCRSLKRVMCSGEALPHEVQERFFASLAAELHNLYGPTEASVDVTSWACVRNGNSRVVPIGRPIANTSILMLDRSLNALPKGIAGELHIGGVGVARGYLGRPDLTAEKFIPDPYSQTPGAHLYKTGDLARHLSDGSIEFLGRLDYQVKIRGFRIELGEIESALASHPSVREAAVLAREDNGHQRLAAYVVAAPGSELAAADLRAHLRATLPEYMVPSAILFMDAMPLTVSGKLNRSALPAPEEGQAFAVRPFVAPDSPIEEILAGIWQEILGVERIGVTDDFFELGGQSILATQLLSRLRQQLFIQIPLRDFFEAPTIAKLAEAITQSQYEQDEEEREMLAELVSEINGLSDEAVKEMLQADEAESIEKAMEHYE